MHFICREKQFTQFFLVAKRINALCPENIGALNFAIQKVQTFWASGGGVGGGVREKKCCFQERQFHKYNIYMLVFLLVRPKK